MKERWVFVVLVFAIFSAILLYLDHVPTQESSLPEQPNSLFYKLVNLVNNNNEDLAQSPPIPDDSGGEGPTMAGTTITLSETPLYTDVQKLGINLDSITYWDAGQLHKNLIESTNVNFEPSFKRIMINCDSSSNGATCISQQQIGAWCNGSNLIENIPSGYFNGATYEVVWGTGKGRTGTVTNYQYINQCSTSVTARFTLDSGLVDDTSYIVIRKNYNAFTTSGLADYQRWFFNKQGAANFAPEQSDLPPSTQGSQSLRLTTQGISDSIIASASFETANNQPRYLYLNGNYRLSFWAKSIGTNNNLQLRAARGGNNYLFQTVTLNSNWQLYNIDFPVLDSRGNPPDTFGIYLTVSGAGANILLDDVDFRQIDGDPLNPTNFRDSVVNNLKAFNPGILRYWAGQLGDTLDNLIAPSSAKQFADYSGWYAIKNDKQYYSLVEFLQLSEHLGTNPWIVVPTMFSNQEMINLIEYLGGPTSTPYGAKRAAHGHPQPWTDSFSQIKIELGNENWNSLFSSASILDYEVYPLYGNERFSAAKTSPYYNSNKFSFVLGAQASNPWTTQQIQTLSRAHDSVAIAPYLYGRHCPAGQPGCPAGGNILSSFTTNEQFFGPLFSETQELNDINNAGTCAWCGLLARQKQAILQSDRPNTELSIYEVNLHSDHGPYGANAQAMSTFNPSFGAALAVGSHMLHTMKMSGVTDQAFFTFSQSSSLSTSGLSTKLWGMAHNYDYKELVRPHYYMLQMINNAIKPTMVTTSHSGDDPSWNQARMNTVYEYSNSKYLLSYAFKENNQYSFIVFNLHRTSSLDITLSLPFTPSTTAQKRTLTAAQLTTNNEDTKVITPTTPPSSVVTLNGFSQNAQFRLPPFSMTVVTFTSSGGGPTLPNNPSNLVANTQSQNSILLGWQDSNNENNFILSRRSIVGGVPNPWFNQSISANVITYTDSGLTSGTNYEYRILANNSVGQSGWSNSAFNTTFVAGPSLSSLSPNNIVHNILRTIQLQGTNFNSVYDVHARVQGSGAFSSYCKPPSSFCNFVSSSRIDLSIPAGTAAGTYDIKVINNDGQESNSLPLIVQSSVCLDGQQRSCSLQAGVCFGSTETCIAGQWLGCTTTTYQSNAQTRFGVNYENPLETICDSHDNNCDGQVNNIAAQSTPLCEDQDGVCLGARKSCGGSSGWLACTNVQYQNNNPNYRIAETILETNICTDNLDNDCDVEYDYDGNGNGGVKGDSGCPVAITGISAPSPVFVSSQFTLNCNTNPDGVATSINGSLDGVACNLIGGGPNTVSFNCLSAPSPTTQVARCDVKPRYSYRSGNSFTSNVQVISNSCSSFNSTSTCEANSACDWCLGCSGNKSSGGPNRCVATGTCGSGAYQCTTSGQFTCGASCNADGGCTQTQTCNLNSCGCTEQNPSIGGISPLSLGWSESGRTITLNGNYFAANAELFVNGVKLDSSRLSRSVNSISFVRNKEEFNVGVNQLFVRNPTSGRNSGIVTLALSSNPAIGALNPNVIINNVLNHVNITGVDFDPNASIFINNVNITQFAIKVNSSLTQLNFPPTPPVGDYNITVMSGDRAVTSLPKNLRINTPFSYNFFVNGSTFNLGSTDVLETFAGIESNFYMSQETVVVTAQTPLGINITFKAANNCIANLSLSPPSCKIYFNITTNAITGQYIVGLNSTSLDTGIENKINITVNVGRCGDGICTVSIGETCNTCSSDCGSCGTNNGGSSGSSGGGGSGGRQSRIVQQCEDGRDNDGDGKIDYPQDTGCINLGDSSELDASELVESNYSLGEDDPNVIKLEDSESKVKIVFWLVLIVITVSIIATAVIILRALTKRKKFEALWTQTS